MANNTKWTRDSIRARLARIIAAGVEPKTSPDPRLRGWDSATTECAKKLGISLPQPPTVTRHWGKLPLLVAEIKAARGAEPSSKLPKREELLAGLRQYYQTYGEFPEQVAGGMWSQATVANWAKQEWAACGPLHKAADFAYHFGSYAHARDLVRREDPPVPVVKVGDQVVLELVGVPAAFVPAQVTAVSPLTVRDWTGQSFRPKQAKVLSNTAFIERLETAGRG